MKIIYESEEKYIYVMRVIVFFTNIHNIQLMVRYNSAQHIFIPIESTLLGCFYKSGIMVS